MPKQKTNRSVRKRVRITKNGKLKRSKAFRRHLLAGRSQKRKRKLRLPGFVSWNERRSYMRLLGEM